MCKVRTRGQLPPHKNGAWEIAGKLGSTRRPNNARPGYWRVRTATTPFGTFTPTVFGWPFGKIFAAGHAGARFEWRPWPFPYSCITGELPLVVRTAVNRRFSSWMRAGDRSDGGGAVQVGNPRGLFSLVQSKHGHAIHIRTTMDFDSKRVVDPDHVCILFVVQPSRTASCPVELVELSPRRVPLDDSIPSSLDGIHNNRPIAI